MFKSPLKARSYLFIILSLIIARRNRLRARDSLVDLQGWRIEATGKNEKE